ncbi:hypothetical protein SBX64_16000 [Vibrio rhizosphaerae]|uniref:DUF2570 domain-containing protein n=1 Tax=Vibrio rhizosphaerae TaxID=398736 RepID=A0ABU4IXB7_9VIBR|nr:hypothetical protein [Vibrio rhizosphaerae]MDW6094042.1 hypothetical protein [Vibrio rhizosphaerae]
MLSLIKYAKYGIYMLVVALSVGVYVKIKTLSADNDRLRTKLTLSDVQVTMQQNVIEQIAQEREDMNSLLLSRAARQIKSEEKLRNEIKKLQEDMQNSTCVIPVSVTNQLRQSY